MPVGLQLKLRLFIEGIEVPIISAALNIQPNAPAQCQIQIPATDKVFGFKPRSLIHVFFYDLWDGSGSTISIESPTPEPQVASASDREPPIQGGSAANSVGAQSAATGGAGASAARIDSSEDDSDAGGGSDTEDSRWKLFFAGEVMGFQFSKSHHQRSMTLQCLDLSVYWDTCYQYKVNVSSLTGDGMAAFVGGGTTFQDTFFASGMSYIVSAVSKRSITQPELTGLLSGVVRLLESVGGVYIGNEARDLWGLNPQNKKGTFKGVNDFFSIAELRLKLVYMITAAEGDESSRRHFARRAFARWGRRRASRLGKISSFREILNSMMEFIYHVCMPCPIARYQHPEDRSVSVSATHLVSFANTRRGRVFARSLGQLSSGISYIRLNLATQVAAQNTISKSHVTGLITSCENLISTASGIGHRPLVEALGVIKTGLGVLSSKAEGSAIRKSSDTSRLADKLDRRARAAANQLRGITTQSRQRRTKSIHIGERLHSQIVKPDIFMCSPPRCNVIFPEHASELSFSREYMREVTRMRLKVSDQIFGKNSLLDRAYYAPDVEVMGAFPPRRRHGRGSEAGQLQGKRFRRAAYSKRIMDHELYTGVIPVFESMNEVNIYAARTDLVTHRGARIPYAIRAVNHQFFKHRWAPRQMSVAGRFNPYVAPGFPTLVLDRYMTKTQLDSTTQRILDAELLTESPEVKEHDQAEFDSFFRTPPDSDSGSDTQKEVAGDDPDSVWSLLRETVPTQFVGLAEGVNHTINQQQAATSLTLTHARAHRENEELLGANKVPLTRRSLVRRTSVRPRAQTAQRPAASSSPTSEGQWETWTVPATRTVGTPGGGTTGQFQASSGTAPTPNATRRFINTDGRAIRNLTVASMFVPNVGDIGPYMGEITEVTESSETGLLPLYGPHFGDRPRRSWTKVPVNQSMLPTAYGPEVIALAGERGVGEDEQVTFRAYRIQEAIERWRGQIVEVPIEDFIRPPWMADVWRNDQIGSVYQQFFGTGAITDAMMIDAGKMLMSLAEADPTSDVVSAAERQVDMQGASPVSEEAVTQRPGMTITIERAIDLLVRMYSLLRHTDNSDVNEFIRAYTWRPVATLVDMLGSKDLEIDADTGEKKEGGIEGLHSRAFGRGEMGMNLKNLVDEEVRSILDFNVEEDRGNVLERMDKRAEKSEMVMQYVRELYENRGLLG